MSEQKISRRDAEAQRKCVWVVLCKRDFDYENA